MPNTFTQLHIQLVFAVKGRQNLIPKAHKDDIHKYITGVVQNRKHKMLAINSMPDHIHIFVGMKPDQSISDLVRDIKTNSTLYINENKFIPQKFNWQNGFGAFSYSQSHIDRVVRYILNQEKHHAQKTFKDEYLEFLEKFQVEFDERYLFEWVDYANE